MADFRLLRRSLYIYPWGANGKDSNQGNSRNLGSERVGT